MRGEQVGAAEDFFDRQSEGVTRDKGMLLIPGGDCATLPGVERVELLADVRALIDGLCIGVAEQKLAVSAPVAESGFECVVTGVGDCGIGGILAVVFTLSGLWSAILTGPSSIDRLAAGSGVGSWVCVYPAVRSANSNAFVDELKTTYSKLPPLSVNVI